MFQGFENLFPRKKAETSPFIGQADDDYAPDTTSSIAKSNQSRQDERAMQDRLDSFMQTQRKADDDNDFSGYDKAVALVDFDKEERANSESLVTEKRLEEEIVYLDGSGRLVPMVGASGNVLKMVGSTPQFVEGFPEGNEDGELLGWSVAFNEWRSLRPLKNTLLWYSYGAGVWEQLEIPATIGKVCIVTAAGLEFNYPVYTE